MELASYFVYTYILYHELVGRSFEISIYQMAMDIFPFA